jgi:hypothetical protein
VVRQFPLVLELTLTSSRATGSSSEASCTCRRAARCSRASLIIEHVMRANDGTATCRGQLQNFPGVSHPSCSSLVVLLSPVHDQVTSRRARS